MRSGDNDFVTCIPHWQIFRRVVQGWGRVWHMRVDDAAPIGGVSQGPALGLGASLRCTQARNPHRVTAAAIKPAVLMAQ